MVTTDTNQTITAQKTFNGSIVSSSIYPRQSNAYSLGDASSLYKEICATTAIAKTGRFDDILPRQTSSKAGSIGSANIKYKNLYLSGDISDGTNSVAVANIASKAELPAAVSGTNDGTNWLTITIGNDTYNIPAGGGSSNGFDFIMLNSSGSSGTFTAAELARIADHPQRCVIVKYGSSAKWVQSYQLREIAYTSTSQTTADTYTFGYIQTNGDTQIRDRKIVITAATGDWEYSQVDLKAMTINTNQTISGVKTFTNIIKVDSIYNYSSSLTLTSTNGFPVIIGNGCDLTPLNDGTQNLGYNAGGEIRR